jgi:hypothetical protein
MQHLISIGLLSKKRVLLKLKNKGLSMMERIPLRILSKPN